MGIRRRWAALSVAAVSLLLASGAARAQEDVCLDCHEVEFTSTAHEGFACADCHGDVDLDTHPDTLPEMTSVEICGQCHDLDPGLVEGPHAAIACVDCHGPAHDVPVLDPLKGPLAPTQQIQTCGECHGDTELMQGYLASSHARALLVSGLVDAPSCSDCHGTHDIFPADDPRASTSRGKVPETCASCHALILDTWEESAHGKAWHEGNQDVPICTTCHSSHEIVDPRLAEVRREAPETCGQCHEEALGTYRDSFHGQATDLGFVTAATCADCHTPHSNLPASDPRSTVNPAHLQTTCGKCHEGATAAFASFDPHSDPADPEGNRSVHGIWLFMTALLIGVFGFFGLHALLWLQRSIVALARGELERPAGHDEGPWVRRFTQLQSRVHVVVVITFLVLAATGLPLKFHHAEWAQTLAALMGGLDATRFLHRVAAILTFGYFLFHIGHLARRALIDKEKGLLFGWSSMVPRSKDVADLWGNLKYFLYLGKKPRLDRFTYWEKFDYFAVFWGVVIIGVSGLALWFPAVFVGFLPGWALNAAFVIHSDEALLATGFIFVFHFFHTHLRPESFPLDPVIFVGSMPLERFKEERPVEYERLVRTGELESWLVEPPSAVQLRRARIFGFAAVAVGLLLVVGILKGMLG